MFSFLPVHGLAAPLSKKQLENCSRVLGAPIYSVNLANGVKLPIIDMMHPVFSEPSRLLEAYRVPFLKQIPTARTQVQTFLVAEYYAKLGLNPEWIEDPALKNLADEFIGGPKYVAAVAQRFRVFNYMKLKNISSGLLTSERGARVQFFDVGGGIPISTINALVQHQATVAEGMAPPLVGRQIILTIVERDPLVGRITQQMLAELTAPSAPLAGLNIEVKFLAAHWSYATPILRYLETNIHKDDVVIASAEGSVFDYGYDHDLTSFLSALRSQMPPRSVLLGANYRHISKARESVFTMGPPGHVEREQRQFRGFSPVTEDPGRNIWQYLERTGWESYQYNVPSLYFDFWYARPLHFRKLN